MKTLKTKKRITLATAKAFVNRNRENLLCKEEMGFNPYEDMVTANNDSTFMPAEFDEIRNFNATGAVGFVVVSGWNSFTIYEDDKYYGIKCYNCCGETIVAVAK